MQLRNRIPRRRRAGLTSRERGATIVLVSLSMVVLLGMAAISIDYAVSSEQRSGVQNAADAAALAVASDCAQNKPKCSAPATNTVSSSKDAKWYAEQTAGLGVDVQVKRKDGTVGLPSYTDRQVTVRVSKKVDHTFARALGSTSSTVSAEAKAEWTGVPLKASKMVPIGLPYCMWKDYNPISGTGSKKGATVQFVWSSMRIGSDQSCAGLPGVTAGTVYGRAASSSSNLSPSGRAVYFTPDIVPGLTFSCAYAPSVWDLYRDDLADYSIAKYDGCMNNQFKKPDGSAVGPGDVLMFPIYAIEKKTWLWGTQTYNSRLVVVGFAPFQIQDFVTYPSIFFGEEPGTEYLFDLDFSKTSYGTKCSFGWAFGLPKLIAVAKGGQCGGVRGKFIQSTDAALFKDFTEFGTYYDNPDSGIGGAAPQLGASKVSLVK